MLSTDSVPGSERLLRDSAFSAGDLHPNSVGRTISTLSAMSEDSAAESSGSEPDPALGVSALPGHGLRLSQPGNVQETFKMIEKPPYKQSCPVSLSMSSNGVGCWPREAARAAQPTKHADISTIFAAAIR